MTTADQQPTATLSEWGHDIYPKLSWFRQDLVDQAHVMVIGCGALGNEVLKNLVLFGVRHLVIVDFDEVEMSNLTRSILYNATDARQHRRKVEAAAERLRAINPAVEVTTIDGDICYDVGLGIIRRMQVVIGCVDNRWARYCINRLCLRAGIPWVDGGIEGLEGTVRVFVPGKNCYACNLGTEGLKDLSRRQPCSGIIRRNEEAGRIPTTPIIASVIGAVEVQEAMKLLHPEQLESGELTSLCGKVFYYEGQHLTTRTAHFEAYDDDCPVHEQWTDIRPSAITADCQVGETLKMLQELLYQESHERHNPAIVLHGDCFVDTIEDRRDGQEWTMMCAGHEVASRMEKKESLRQRMFSDFYQHEYRVLDNTFPYPELTLSQVGIPPCDVLHVKTSAGDYYFEMNDSQPHADGLYI